MRMKIVVIVSTLAMMSAYALGEGHAPQPWALDPSPPGMPPAPPPELKGLVGRATPSQGGDGNADSAIDLTALRYFISNNDLKRAAAEIRLIRVKHPEWSPSEDLFNESGATADESPIWRLFEKGDYQGARDAIANRKDSDPSWHPSSDLVNKLTLAEAAISLRDASDGQNWEDTIRIASENKMLLSCDYVDVLWRVAEALARTQDDERAHAAYKYILQNCGKSTERVATIEKAIALFGPGQEIDDLVALGRRGPDGRNEFEFVKWDRIRAAIGKAATDPTAVPPAESDVRALVAHLANSPKAREDQNLLGWWFYAQHDFAQAEAFFRKASQNGWTSKSAEGLVLTLKAEDKLPEALTLARQFADLGPANRKAWANLELAQLLGDDKATLASSDETALDLTISEQKDADGAQALGWRFYRNGNLAQARKYFENSLAWRESEPAAVGLVATLRRLGDAHAYAATVAKYSKSYTKVADFVRIAYQPSYRTYAKLGKPAHARTRTKTGGWDSEADTIVSESRAGLHPEALLRLDARRARVGGEPAGLTLIRGWALYNAHRFEDAGNAFRAAYNAGLKSDAQKGLAMLGSYATAAP